MKKIIAISICSLAVILLSVSCSKEPVTNPPDPPIMVTPNWNPVDSLSGKEFIFDKLSWTLDGIYLVCVVNRPDLFI